MTKKRIILIGSGIVVLISVFLIYRNYHIRSTSFSTPSAALNKVQHPKTRVSKIIDTEKLKSKSQAFVFFYSEVNQPDDYLGVAECQKGKYGWQFVKMFGAGHISKTNANGKTSTGGKEILIGFATSSITKVELGTTSAKLIQLNNKNLKVWVFFYPQIKTTEQLKFITSKGAVINKESI